MNFWAIILETINRENFGQTQNQLFNLLHLQFNQQFGSKTRELYLTLLERRVFQ